MLKKCLAVFLCVLIFMGQIHVVYAAEPTDYRVYFREETDGDVATKPTANFTITVLKPDGSVRCTAQPSTSDALAYDKNGKLLDMSLIPKITAYVGDTIIFKDDSDPGSGSDIDACDFQWYSDQATGKMTTYTSVFEAKSFELTQPDYWELYYNVRDNYFSTGVRNWSDNGCHVTLATNNADFPDGMWWYFTRVDVEVLSEPEPVPNFKITYNGTDVTNKNFEISSFPCEVTLTDTSTAEDGAKINSRKWQAFSNAELEYKPISSSASTINYTITADQVSSVSPKYFLLELNGKSSLKATHYCRPYLKEAPPGDDDPEPPDPDPNEPPEVELDAPEEVKAGEEFSVIAFASDPDGDDLTYTWGIGRANGYAEDSYGTLWYDKEYAGTRQSVQISVYDGKERAGDVARINVTEPSVNARLQVSGTLKENRKVTLTDNSDSPDYYPIKERNWIVSPVTSSGVSEADIKYNGVLDSKIEDLLFKKAGTYEITLTLTNTAGYTDTVNRTITIAPDEKPVAELSTPTTVYRDPGNFGDALILLNNISYSPDNDIVAQCALKYKYDSDNDTYYDDETWITLSDAYFEHYTFKAKEVGKYLFQIDIKENFGQETILDYISDSDYQTNSDTIIVNVANTKPTVAVKMMTKEKIDIVFAVGDAQYDTDSLNSKINSIVLPALRGSNLDVNTSVVDGYSLTGNYYYDIYNGFGNWGEETIETDRTGWVSTREGNLYEPNFASDWGYHQNSRYNHTGMMAWQISYSVGTDNETGKIFSRTQKTLYDHIDYKRTDEGVAKHKFDTTKYTRIRYLLDNGHTNEHLGTVLEPNGILPDDGRITSMYSIDNKYFYDPEDASSYHNGPEKYTLKGHWSINRGPEGISSLDVAYTNTINKYRADSKKYLVYLCDDEFVVSEATKLALLENQIYFVGIGNSANKSIINSIINSDVQLGQYIENSDVDNALNHISSYIISQKEDSLIESYVICETEFTTDLFYDDYENDPMYANRWRYTHDPNYFENSLGKDSNVDVYLLNPKTVFSKPGKYIIETQVRDNPVDIDNRFDGYRLWSEVVSMNIFAHRRPVAEFSITVKSGSGAYAPVISDTSYDLDHTSRSDKGIAARKWSWMQPDSGSWNIGLPSTLSSDTVYMFCLEVQDIEGSWSVPSVQMIDTGNVNLPPLVDANPQSASSDTNIPVIVTADDLGENDLNHTDYYWSKYTSKPSGTWTTRTTKTFTTTLVTEGTWYLHMEAFDNSGQSFYTYRGPYTLVKNLPPPPPPLDMNASLVPNPALSGDEIIFTVDTVGYADKIVISVDQDIVQKDNRTGKYAYPLVFNVNGGINQKTNILRYITCVKTEQTLTKDNVRRRSPYTFVIRAYRGAIYREVELTLDVRRSVLELLHPGVKTN